MVPIFRCEEIIRQKDEEGCATSSLAATADETVQPCKRFKPESPGEARKNSLTTDYLEPPSDGSCYVDRLPDEIVLKVFSNLYETDLSRCAGVSGRFYRISNDVNLWKTLYQGAFEYTVPMYHPTHGKFELREPHRWRDTLNPWKESFRQLRHAIHVRPRYGHIYEGHIGRNIPHFETLTQALQWVDNLKLIYLFVYFV
ncbi:unnamed protein product [Nippostrongylus brasiliensis]|uniref:F-box only protein 11 (inferred by orthology to a human protein) n=1 Tax=Nippostrongylus brasiliensis TaxID=27835 RepID=A0A158R3H7_NIPBR|nr:unnamed protein product [Nippostrongylus brasiliensis]